jgi:hypothetical protein
VQTTAHPLTGPDLPSCGGRVAARADHGPAVRGTRHERLLLPVHVGWKVGSRPVLSRDATFWSIV